jgi:hypothetical protein
MALKICIKKTKEIFLQSLGQEFCTKTRMYLLSLNLNRKLAKPLSNEYKPTPTTMWISSINKMIFQLEAETFNTALSLSSISPRNLAPANTVLL